MIETKNVYKLISNAGVNWNELKHIHYILNNRVYYDFVMSKDKFDVIIHNHKDSKLATRTYSMDKLEQIMFTRHQNLRQCGNAFKKYTITKDKDLKLQYG